MDYRIDASGEKIKVKQELTPARRFSFLVGENESSHTAQSCLAPILQDDARDPTFKDLEDAFSIEKVTKEFFGQYRNLFNDVKDALDEIVEKDSKIKQIKCRIPFLNGGLFDPINDYDWVNTDILLPDALFSNDIRTKEGDTGTGILNVFDRYNFTVKEDEPLEKEVAIDPEMLGKVFESAYCRL